jgi:hypothetical protein
MSPLRLVVEPPSGRTGGRRVRVDGEILGLAYSARDVVEFARRAGLEDVDLDDEALIVCKHVSRPHGTDEFWYHPRTGGRRLARGPDGLFSLARLVHQPITDPVAEHPSEPKELRALEPKEVLTDSSSTGMVAGRSFGRRA